MALSVADVLELEALRQGQATVIAGAEGLRRPVRWVHIAEGPDIAHLLKGGELLLTTGVGLAGDAHLQRRYIRELVDGGVVGLVIEMGRIFTEPPPAMVEEVRRTGVEVHLVERTTDRDIGRSRQIRTGGSAPW
jgi:purine catabolism regulator